MSWRTLDSKGCEMRASAGLITVFKDANILLVAKKFGNAYLVLQDEESARAAHVDLSYLDWHAALGHPSAPLTSFSHMYTDGHLLPSHPKNFHCEPCAIAKSTHSVPLPHAAR